MIDCEKHLWEIDHPYYCNEGNYFSNDCVNEFDSWRDYISCRGDEDTEYNLIFRWDWVAPDEPSQDIYYRDGLLKLFYMGQRKGIFSVVIISVCEADEPIVREFLLKRFESIKAIWEPFK